MSTRLPLSETTGTGLGETQRQVLELLKRDGPRSAGDLAAELGFAVETLRGHLQTLGGHGLVTRRGTRKEGPGRPEILYGLTEAAEALFPSEEAALLRDLASHLLDRGHEELLEEFFEARIRSQREEARERLSGLGGRERLEEVAAVLSEHGFMAEVVEEPVGEERGAERLGIRLCHCPLKEMVSVTTLPCRAEIRWVEQMVGSPLERKAWMPEGDRTCTYLLEEPPTGP